MKKNQFFKKISLICILGFSTTSYIPASDYFDDFADYDLGSNTESIGSKTRAVLPPINPDDLNISPANYAAWFDLLAVTDLFDPTSPIKVKNALLNNFFLQSNRLVSRNINNYPFALHFDYTVSEKDTFNTNLFMNGCRQKYISSAGNTLESIVDFENQGIEDILATVDLLTGGVLAEASSMDLFAPGRIEERKMGALFQYMHRDENWFFRAQVPFMYIERNLQFTKAQKDAIYNSPLVQILANWANNNSGTPVSQQQLSEDFFVVDQIGFGNVHLGGMHNLIDSEKITLKLGGYLEFPTEWAFKQGIKGNWYSQDNSGRNPLIMAAINPTIPVTLNTAQLDMLTAFFLGSVNQMSANVLNTSLGNTKHTALAVQTDFAWYPFERAYFQGYFAGQYMLPAQEQRFFIKQAGTSYTNYLATITDPFTATSSQMVAVVNGFAQELQDRLYPYAFTTQVQPGLMLNLFASVEIPVHKWHFSLGANGWYQAQETLFDVQGTQINGPGALVKNLNSPSEILALLDLDAARGFTAYQVKPFVQIDYHCDHQLLTTFSLYADYTVANESTGNDLTFNLTFSTKF